jgi:hypothetical protein
MENKVLSWNVALDKGCEPRLFPYAAEEIPLGQYDAVFDFKSARKKQWEYPAPSLEEIPAKSFS